MKKILTALITLLSSNTVFASGCFNDFFRHIESNELIKTAQEDQFTILSTGESFAQVKYQNRVLILIKQTEIFSESKQTSKLLVEDIIFSEGSDCGYIYTCKTGRLTLIQKSTENKNISSIFTWPIIVEGNSRTNSDLFKGTSIRSLIKVFGNTRLPSGTESDVNQCIHR